MERLPFLAIQKAVLTPPPAMKRFFINITGTVNTAIGAGAFANNTTGDHNTARRGFRAL